MSVTWICTDASIVVRLVIQNPENAATVRLWKTWHQEGRLLAGPTLLYYEVSTALRRYVTHAILEPGEATDALEAALGLGIHLIGDANLHRRALEMAQIHSLPATYDAHYLAAAERLSAELWTADRRLFGAVNASLRWVKLLEDQGAGS